MVRKGGGSSRAKGVKGAKEGKGAKRSRRVGAKDRLDDAIAAGKRAALEVKEFRLKQARKRMRAATTAPARARARATKPPPAIPVRTAALFAPSPSAGILLAEGDSWFDYPFHDVLRILEDEYFYDVQSVAHAGDCVEDMAYSDGQFEQLARRLEKLLREGKVPTAILLSGGGNDIAGDEFALLLNHAASQLPTINEDIVTGVIDVRLRNAYGRILGGLSALTKSYLNVPIPVITHGYDYPIPDGRGVLGGFGPLPGPWLRPGFERKGYTDMSANKTVMVSLIDRFNAMLEQVSAHPDFAHVHYVNLRRVVREETEPYKSLWANELHPKEEGFRRVSAKFAEVIQGL